MNTPGLAIVWGIWSRHRTGFIASAATVAALALACPLLALVAPRSALAAGSTLPLVFDLMFVLNALVFVEREGSLTSRYPRYLLALPVRTRTLVLLPIVLSTVIAALWWAAVALLIYRPCGVELPVLVPCFALAALMTWAQACGWLPIAIPWVREIANIVLVAALGALPLWLTITGRASTEVVSLMLAVYTGIALAVAWAAVASDRHGQSWQVWPAGWRPAALLKPLERIGCPRSFSSAFGAQIWYEWRCHGLMLNGFVMMTLCIIWTIMMAAGKHGDPSWFAFILGLLVIVVVAVTGAAGISLGRLVPLWTRDEQGRGTSFVATRPMTTGRLVAAKFVMAAASVYLNWASALAGTMIWIVVSDNLDNARSVMNGFLTRYSPAQAIAIIGLGCVVIPALCWRQLTGNVVPVLTGRRWVADGVVSLLLAGAVALAAFVYWLTREPARIAGFYTFIPWLVVALAIVRLTIAVIAFRAALEQGLMSWQNVAGVLALWLFITGCGIALAAILAPVLPISAPRFLVALGIATLVPLVRFPLATLALEWNRHR